MSQRGGGKPFYKEFQEDLNDIGLPKVLITKVAKNEHLVDLDFVKMHKIFGAVSNEFADIYNSTGSQRTDGRPFPEIRWDREKLKLLLAKMIAIYKYCSESDDIMKDQVKTSMRRVIKYNLIYWNDLDRYMNERIPFELPSPPSSINSSGSPLAQTQKYSPNTAEILGGKLQKNITKKSTKAPAKKSK